MKRIEFAAAIAVSVGLSACNRDNVSPDVFSDYSGGCEAVDLGLVTRDGKILRWAVRNVGASVDDAPGTYFAWGETAGKDSYDWAKEGEYKWGVFKDTEYPRFGMTKYTADTGGGDGLVTLQSDDDPAIQNWGTKWRTPTVEEIGELLDNTNCEWTWDAVRKGYTVRGRRTGKSIFLPASGCRGSSQSNGAGPGGFYWSSSVVESGPFRACYFYFNPDCHIWSGDYRCYGMPVRAVTEY